MGADLSSCEADALNDAVSSNVISGLRILVIDDDQLLCQEIKLRLEELGYVVAVAHSGEEGIAQVESFQPQLLLIDWLMEGMNGLDVCRILRQSRFGQLLYIMVFTQYDNEDLLVEAYDAGVDDYIPKPITPRVLSARIQAGERLIKLQEEVERERREAHRYLDIVEMMMLGLDMHGNITLVNRKGCEVLGYTERELLGCNWFGKIIPEDYCEPIRALFEYALTDDMQGLGYFETQLVTRTGERRRVVWHSSVISDEGKVSGFLFAAEDVTDQRRADKEREQLSKNLQQAQKMQSVGNLTGGIAHNFNNILASVIGYSELAQEQISDTGDDSLKFYIDNIHKAGIEARGLIETLMSFSRGANGESQVALLPPVLQDIERMLKPLLTSSIHLTVKAETKIPRVMVNPEHVHQMVTNLCINARDALGDSGEIVVSLSHQQNLSAVCDSCHEKFDGEFVELSVVDNGSGISETVLESIFEPFFSTKGVAQATGLGLPMVHGSMHGCGGHILVTAGENKGTAFRLLFPVLNEPS